jgi:group I intron endonuclease
MDYSIYCITNKLNGKSYIGQSCKVEERWKNHILDAKRVVGKTVASKKYALQNAILKYGEDNFSWEIIKIVETLDEVNQAEEFYIAYLQTLFPNGYNLLPGGKNRHPTEIVKQKISDTLKITSFFIGKKGADHPNYGRHITEEIKIKQRAKLSGDNGPNKKITSEIAKEIYLKCLNDSTLTAKDLATEYRIGHSTVLNILNKKSWKKVLNDLPTIILKRGSNKH